MRRVDLDKFAVTSEFRVRPPESPTTDYVRSGIAVMPGNPQTVAVCFRSNAPRSDGYLALFDNGTKRPNHLKMSYGCNGLLFAPDGKSVFLAGYVMYDAPQSVLRYQIDAGGVPDQTPVAVTGGEPVAIRDGLLYTSKGTIIDIQKQQLSGSFGVSSAVALDATNQRALTARLQGQTSTGEYPCLLQAFDLTTQEPLASQELACTDNPPAGTVLWRRLLRFGVDGVLYTNGKSLLLFHTPLAGPAPYTIAAAVANAASQKAGAIAPGEILSIYGTNLGPITPVTPQGTTAFPFTLGDVQVWFDSQPGALLMTYQNQINVVAPFGLQPGSTVNLQVWNRGIPSLKTPLTVAQTAPALITRDGSGAGQAAVINQDGTVNTPAPAGSIVMLYGTGGGMLPGAADGALARKATTLDAPVRVSLGGREAVVAYAGAAPMLVHGVFQLNVQIPSDMPPGPAPIAITINGQESPKGPTLEIR